MSRSRKIYLNSDIAGTGDGSFDRPYNSFAQAEANPHWKVLKILPTNSIIIGSLTLRDDQQVKGTRNNKPRLAIDVNDGIHNGDIFTCNGDNKFKHLIIEYSYRSAFNCLNSKNLKLENVDFNNINMSQSEFNLDNSIISYPFAAVNFVGGITNLLAPSPVNQRNGHLKIKNCTFDNTIVAVMMATGARRTYEIEDSIFGGSVIIAAMGGSQVSGKIHNSEFRELDASGIVYLTENAGSVKLGLNEVYNCSFDNVGDNCVEINVSAALVDNNARFVVAKCNFIGFGLSSPFSNPTIDDSYSAVRDNSRVTAIGYYELEMRSNIIIDDSHLTTCISSRAGGNIRERIKIIDNVIRGGTVGISISSGIVDASDLPLIGGPIVNVIIDNNELTDMDSAIVIYSQDILGTEIPFGVLNFTAVSNCIRNIGAMHSPSIEGNGSYYGGGIILGGYNNTSLGLINGDSETLGNVTVRFDSNSFANFSGPQFWIAEDQIIRSTNDYYGNIMSDAGAGGTLILNNQSPVDQGCFEQSETNSSSSSNSSGSESDF